LRPEDLYTVSLTARDIGYIYHAHIHTDIAHIGCWATIHDAVATAIAEVAVEAVGISYGDGGDA
jgi:hypothetical protein